jgi:putative aldouronate transport system permease protein
MGQFMVKLNRMWNDRVLYYMLLPLFVFFIIFNIWPIVGMKLAFYDYMIIGEHVYVGMKHFQELFSSPIFMSVLANTLIISLMKLLLIFPLPVIFALMLNEFSNGIFRKAIQVITYLPHFLSWVVIMGVCIEFLSPETGILNLVIKALGFNAHNFLTDKSAIRWVLVASEAWRSVGWDSIIFLAAILGINPNLYEAAYVDGASRLDIARHIVIPHLYLSMVTIFILNLGFLLYAGLDQVWNFTNASVQSKIEIIDTYVYRVGLMNYQYSLATAASLFKSIIGVILILTTHFISKKLTSKGAW